MNISHLVEKIKKGDNKSFEKLYKLTEREVWFTCISFLKNETTAQDIMQETYITAFLKIQSLEKSSQIRSWLNRIAVNKCKNYLKGKGEIQLDDEIFENQAIVDERISIPEEYISDKAKREIILSIMQEVLSDVQYQTVIMHYFNEMTVDEIAEVFECSRGTVLSRLNYSRAKMKTAIEDYEKKTVTSFTVLLLYLSLQLFSRKKQRALQYRTLQSSSRTDRHLQHLQQKALRQVQSQQFHLS